MLYKGVAKGIREKPIEVAVKSVKGEGGEELGGVTLIGIHGFYELHIGSCCVITILSSPPLLSFSSSPLTLIPFSFPSFFLLLSLSPSEDALEDDLKLLVAEMEQLSSLGQHPNIVSLVRVCTVGSEWTVAKPHYTTLSC